ncbi:hypothetical protein O7632_29215 [Solwaraspora sp. WMMD406]|uniref:hypothetical protein n=1 Tax=Solwaraspora sp. WMMD406 TaxID=3016095 RepID=UPI002417CA0F|nr:hypothetical protein [Solwaraspora sp. WMMD406]MDG4768140.1 hypothetical protein [Solwaraspora sp. WMMD406]
MRDISQFDGGPAVVGAARSDVGAWAVVIPAQRIEAERLFHHDTLELTGLDAGPRPAFGAPVLVVTGGDQPFVVALGRVGPAGGGTEGGGTEGGGTEGGETRAADPQPLVVHYTCRAFDDPVPATTLTLTGPVTPVDESTYRSFAGRLAPAGDRRDWLVSIDLPIEAPTAAEAVRLFWSYVRELGPRELPTFVYPSGNELAMQAFVLGAEANQDPEEDD